MKRLVLALVLLSLLNAPNFAQGEGALPVMTLQTSLPLLGAGWIGTAKPNNDPIGYYLNPAILGYTSQNNHLSIFFMPQKVNWIPYWPLDLTVNIYGFNVGYNLVDEGLPISIGFGYMHNVFDYGTFNRTSSYSPEIIGQLDSYDSYDAYSIGVGLDYYLLFNFGMSIKPFDSNLSALPTENEVGTYKVKGIAYDYGAMIVAPISKLFFNDLKYSLYETYYIKPNVNFTLGYAVSNIGDEISYNDDFQKDPLSRTERLGYTFDFGFDTIIKDTEINLFTYSFTAEVEDILIKQTTQDGILGGKFDGYQSLLGDIDIWNNLVMLKTSDKIIVHKGHTLNLLETFTITSGSFKGKGYSTNVGTTGYGLSSEGIFKVLGNSIDNPTLKYFVKHFIIEYYDITIFKNYNAFDTDMQGISLHMKNFEL